MSKQQKNHELLSKAYALHRQGRVDDARKACQGVLSSDPNNPDALVLMGTIHLQRGYAREGVRLITLSLDINPNQPYALINLGMMLQELGRDAEAVSTYDKAMALMPVEAVVHYNRAAAVRKLKRYAQALEGYARAIGLAPRDSESHNNMGLCYHDLGRYEEALACYDKAVACNPGNGAAYNNRGSTLRKLKRDAEALLAYGKAIAINPRDAVAFFNRAQAHSHLKNPEAALADYQKAMALAPDTPDLASDFLFFKMQICLWQDLDSGFAALAKKIEAGEAVEPFPLFATPLSEALQHQNAQAYAQKHYPPGKALWKGERYGHDKIRVGYFSADFYDHATAFLTAELFELHDRSTFEIYAFSFSAPSEGAMRQRLEKSFDRFIDVSSMSDSAAAALVREMEIDIAIDLGGFTRNARTGIFAQRPAPVQASYLGFAGSMGAPYIDYVIADKTVIPEDNKKYYSEKVVWLPHSYQVNDRTKPVADKNFTRAELGLPDTGFVFCAFNNSHKLTPDAFGIWMRLLHNTPGSVLWLLQSSGMAASNVRKEAQARGIDPARLVFAPRMNLSEHLARHKCADVFLDMFYHNAHTTMSDALWAGLPALTCLGEKFSARVAASLLQAIGLPELITTSHAAYEALALELAHDPEKLAGVRRTLAANRASAPLFNTPLFTRDLEAAYTEIWQESLK